MTRRHGHFFSPLDQRSDQFALLHLRFLTSLEFRECMAETLRVKAKQRLGPRVFLSLFINNKNLCCTTDIGKLAIHWHISLEYIFGSQVRVLVLLYSTITACDEREQIFYNILEQKAHLIVYNTYLVCYLSIHYKGLPLSGINLVCLPIPWPKRTRVIP